MLRVADILVTSAAAYIERFGECMLPSHRRALRDICACRTPACGGHLLECSDCGHRLFRYHSCGNRHCPRCHLARSERWMDAWLDRLLPCSYYLLTFTLPAELRDLARSNQKVVYAAMMRAATSSLQELAMDERWVGARLGLLTMLHTWSSSMAYHPHVHILATAGGLRDDDDGTTRWVDPRNPRFLVPGYILSKLFRAEMRRLLTKAGLVGLTTARVWNKAWVVHCKHAGAGQEVLRYMARYLDRVAISDSRIEFFDGEYVRFCFRDRQRDRTQRMTLPVLDFTARYLQHVLPRGFAKVRAYGLFAATCRDKLDQARELLTALDPVVPPDSISEDDPPVPPCKRCPACETGHLQVIATYTALDLLLLRLSPRRPRSPP